MPDIAYQITIIDNIKYFQFNTKILGCNFVNISGISYFKDTIHRDSFKSIYGCDSIIATPIQVTKSKIKHDTISACVYTKFKNRIYTFTVLYADSIVIKSKSNPNCDSLVTYYHVYIWPNPIAKITPSIPNPVLTNQTVILVASGGTKYLWIHDSSRNDSIKYIAEFKDSTTFIVYVYNENNCFDTAMYTILNYDKCSEYFIPNVFTPNGDDVNDYFMPMLGRCIHTKLFMIFDRWGEKMFETNSDHHGWDGRFKGEYMPPGLFIYHAEIITPDGIQTRNGNVLLVR